MKNNKPKFKIRNIFKSKLAKLSVLILSSAALASLILTGCQNSKEKAKNSVVEITLWSHKPENDEAIKSIAKDFEKKSDSKIKLNVVSTGGATDYGQQLKTAMTSGKVPDIFNFSSFGEMQDYLNYLKPIEEKDMPILKNIDKKWLASATNFNNQVYGIPECLESLGFWVNAEIFKLLGVDIKTMNSWDGLTAACEKLKDAISNKSPELLNKFPNINGVWLLALTESWIQGNHSFIPFINMDFYSEGANTKENPIHAAYKAKELPGKGFDLYKQYIDFLLKYAQEGYASADYSSIIDQALFSRLGAITQQGTWLINKIKDFDKNGSNIGKELEFLPFSTPGGATDNKYVVYVGQYFGISKNISTEKYNAIKDFLKYFYECKEYTDKCDFISPIKNSNQNFSSSSRFNETVKKAMEENRVIPGDLSVIRTEAFHKDVLGTSIQKYAQSDRSQTSWEAIVVNPAKKAWKEMSERQNNQLKN